MFFKKSRLITILLLISVLFSTQVSAVDGIITAKSPLNFREEPSLNAKRISTIAPGERVEILSEVDDSWYNISYNGVEGYVSAEFVQVEANYMQVRASGGLNLREADLASSKKIGVIPNGARVEVLSEADGWAKVVYGDDTGFVSTQYLVKADTVSRSNTGRSGGASETAQLLLDYAASFQGVPYKYGGASPSGFDCSGYVVYVFSNFGYNLPRTATQQAASSLCVPVAKADLIPGDLVFFKLPGYASAIGHVGIYAGDGRFIHATSPGDVVKYDLMSSSYYTKNYVTARRVIQ